MMKKRFLGIIVIFAILMCCVSASFKSHENLQSRKDQIIGVWKFSNPSYNILNVITKGHSVIIWLDLSGKEITSSHGGSYTFDGETYISTARFGTQHWQSNIGSIGVLKVRFENNKMYRTGKSTLNGVDTNINEVWERIE